MIISDSTSGALSGIPAKGQQVYYCLSSPSCDPDFNCTSLKSEIRLQGSVTAAKRWDGMRLKPAIISSNDKFTTF